MMSGLAGYIVGLITMAAVWGMRPWLDKHMVGNDEPEQNFHRGTSLDDFLEHQNKEVYASLVDAESENKRLYGHVENLQNLLADIAAQETKTANATVKRMAAMARAGMAK